MRIALVMCERLSAVSRQNGVVLLISLIFLLVVTLIATTGMQNTILEERMAGNFENYALAFQAAEAALDEAERWIQNQSVQPDLVSAPGNGVDVWHTGSVEAAGNTRWYVNDAGIWWGTDGHAEILEQAGGDLAEKPRYVIEQYAPTAAGESLNPEGDDDTGRQVVYRITARGAGADTQVVVYLQSTYARTFY